MRYRGFEITSTADYGITRIDKVTGENETCKGYYCEIYSVDDDNYANLFDSFCLAQGHEIPDCSYSSLVEGIARYVDGYYNELEEAKSDAQSNRNHELLGRALCWLDENECGPKLYLTLSEVLGMKDEEINAMGFSSLVPYFDRDDYAQTIANYLIDEGTEDTMSGNLHIPFSEINEKFGVTLPDDDDLLDRIKYCIGESEAVADIETNEDFDLMFHTVFCPNIEDRFGETEDENISLNM